MKIFDIVRGSFVDGPGIRTTVFFKGCNLKCQWCHNPEGIMKETTFLHYENLCKKCGACNEICLEKAIRFGKIDKTRCIFCGKCQNVCPMSAIKICGKEISEDEVFDEILKDRQYYETNGGATFSGGECMLQIDSLYTLLKKCKENGIGTAVDTAGNVPWEYFEKIIPYVDLFLFDVKVFSSDLHKRFVGVDNTLILENLRRLSSLNMRIWIRIPLILGVNTSDDEIIKIKTFLKEIRYERIDILPYHKIGDSKYVAMGLIPPNFSVLEKETVETVKNCMSKIGI